MGWIYHVCISTNPNLKRFNVKLARKPLLYALKYAFTQRSLLKNI